MYDKKIRFLFILIGVLLLIGFGVTFAYFTSSTDFENEFNTALYQTEATETFTSPQNWMPGDETPKTLTITNTGNVDVKARVCISEVWESDNGDTLPNTQNGESVAIINLDNTDEWTKKGNCYEYNDVLEPNDTTSSFIESVTFNPNVDLDITCTTSTSGDSTTKTCGSTGDGYDNATYTLTLRVETIQASVANKMWAIYFANRQVDNEITIGDEVCIDTECFYVINSNSNKTTLFSKYNLLVGKISDRTGESPLTRTLSSSDDGYGLQNEIARGFDDVDSEHIIGIVAFSGKGYWDNAESVWSGTNLITTYQDPDGLKSEYANESNLEGTTSYVSSYPYVYRSNIGNTIAPQYSGGIALDNGYTIAYFVEEYVDRLKDIGAPDTISARLLSYEEADSLSSAIIGDWSYWLGSAKYKGGVWNINKGVFATINLSMVHWNGSNCGVRPVIEIPTSELN